MRRSPIIRRAGHAAALLVMLLLGWKASALAQGSDSMRAFLVEYRCPVVERLERIYEHGDPAVARDRFLSVTATAHPHGYLQCMFAENRSLLVCEASSGFYFGKPGTPRTFYLPSAAVEALGRIGFSTDDQAGNFQYEAAIASPPDFNAIADMILTALHDAYGARAATPLRFNAPFAPGRTTTCIPVG